jgi:hypothetical protein
MIRESFLMRTLTEHPSVSEILLCHSKPSTAFEFDHGKVKNINAVKKNQEMGLALRFHYCATAANEWVMHVDDDMELDASAVTELVRLMMDNPHRIVGHYGRSYHFWKVPHRHGYDYATLLSGPVEVILTKVLILEKQICKEFLKHAKIMQDMVQNSKPMWNGEDIFVNVVANHYYSVPWSGPFNNFAVADLNVWEASNEYKDDDIGISDVSGNMDRHGISHVGFWNWWIAWVHALKHSYYRGKFWATAKRRLAMLPS